MVPPNTASPARFATGRLSPLSIDSSRAPRAVQDLAIDRHAFAGAHQHDIADDHVVERQNRVPARRAARAPSSAGGRRGRAARAEVCRFARDSKVLPTSTSAMMNNTAS
jgi:hypothetical protein